MINSRQLEVLTILLAKERTTAKEIANLLDVSTRTVERCIDSLSLKGVPVTSQRGRNGGVAIERKYKMDTHLLTERDIQELFVATNLYDHVFDTQFQGSMQKKVSLLNPDSIQAIDKITKKFLVIDLYEEKISIDEQLQHEIANALNKEYTLEIQTKKNKLYMIPLCYVLKKEGMYLYGYDGEYRLVATKNIYKIARIEGDMLNKPEKFILYKENKLIDVVEE